MTVVASNFDETKHPRRPSGTEKGGEFAPKSGGDVPAGFPPGIFDPEDSVKFWPEKMGSYPGYGPLWKAILNSDGDELAFWFANEGGSPHHQDMMEALGFYDDGEYGFIAGHGKEADLDFIRSQMRDEGSNFDFRAEEILAMMDEEDNHALWGKYGLGLGDYEGMTKSAIRDELIQDALAKFTEIPRRHRRDIRDANEMLADNQKQALAASALDFDTDALVNATARLQRQYEKVYRRAAKRAATDYRRLNTVVRAAGQPEPQEVVQAIALLESFERLTGLARRELLKEVWKALTVTRAAEGDALSLYLDLLNEQIGVQAARLVNGAQEAAADVLLDAQALGWSIPQAATALQEKLETIAPWQATMLARTDLISLGNGASLRRAVLLDDPSAAYKTWLATPDERTRVDHRHAHGQTVPIQQPFTVAGEQLLYPGDPAASDAQTINCRCTVIYSDSPLGPAGIQQVVMKSDLAVSAAAWDESKHPRYEKGSERGGEFKAATDYGFPEDDEWVQARLPYDERGVTVYRGIKVKEPSAFDFLIQHEGEELELRKTFAIEYNQLLDWKTIGIHWTTDRKIAEGFSNPGEMIGGMKTYGLLMEAQVLPEDIVQSGTEEMRYYGREAGVVGPHSYEKEITVRPGALIRIRRGTAKRQNGQKISTPNMEDILIPAAHTYVEPFAGAAVTAAAWDEEKHPRHPAGSEDGGEFAPKEGTAYPTVTMESMPIEWEVRASAWDPAEHPRHPPGSPEGGEFAADGVRIIDSHVSEGIPSVEIEPTEMVDRRTRKRYKVYRFVADGGVGNPNGYVWGHGNVMKANGEEGVAHSTSVMPVGGIPEQVLEELRRVSGLVAAAWDPAQHPRHPPGSPEGGEFARKDHYYGAMVAREGDDEHGRAIGYQAFRMERGERRGQGVRTLAGPVRETYQEAAEDARAAAEAESGSENAAGAHVDWSEAEQEFRDWADGLREYYEDDVAYEQALAEAWGLYQDGVNTQLPALQARLNGAQVPGLTIVPQLNGGSDGDMMVVLDPEAALDYAPDFEVRLPAGAPGELDPSFTVWTYPEGANERHANDPDWYAQPEGIAVEDVLDITDTDFFPDGPDSELAGNYARALDAARGVPDEPGYVTIYRGMSDSEFDAWDAGDEIPLGKFFAGIPTAQYAQDISGEPPQLYSFRVPRNMLLQVGEYEYQLKKKGRMQNGRIEPLQASAWDEEKHPRHPAGSEDGGEFAPRRHPREYEHEATLDHAPTMYHVTSWEAARVSKSHLGYRPAVYLWDDRRDAEETLKEVERVYPGRARVVTFDVEGKPLKWDGGVGYDAWGNAWRYEGDPAELVERDPFTASAVKYEGTGGMVCLYPDPKQAEAIAREGGQPADELHVTLLYFEEGVPGYASEVLARVDFSGLKGTISGIARFQEGEDGVPVVGLVSAVGLNELRAKLAERLSGYSERYGFIPHLTLGYGDVKDADGALGKPVTFGAVSVKNGEAKREDVLTAAGWDETKHPRHAKGNEKGGEFAAKQGPVYGTQILPSPAGSQRLLNELHREISEWPDEEPRRYATWALERAEQSAESSLFLTRRDGRLTGVGVTEPWYDEGGDDLYGPYAGAIEGSGLELFREMVRETAVYGVGLSWEGTAESSKLYRKIGASEMAPGLFYLTTEDVRELAKDLFSKAREKRKSPLTAAGWPHAVEWPENWWIGRAPVQAAGWDESQHPRWPKGHPEGGKFKPKEGAEPVVDTSDIGTVGSRRDPGWSGPELKPETFMTQFGGASLYLNGLERSDHAWDTTFREDLGNPDATVDRQQQLEALRLNDMDLPAYKRAIGDNAAAELRGVELVVRTKFDGMLGVVEDEEFHTQFVTASSSGAYAPENRAIQERMFFGYPQDQLEGRPVYGYAVTSNWDSFDELRVGQYGPVRWTMKDSLRPRTTVTGVDSLSRRVIPGPIDNPGWRSTLPSGFNDRGMERPRQDELTWGYGNGDLVETQHHGGVALGDVESLQIEVDDEFLNSHSELREAVARLRARGIPVNVVGWR